MKDYNRSNTDIAKKLRKNMTPWERKLWYTFLRTYPIRFQRQKPIGNRIVDFYCAKADLAVELDGGGHFTPQQSAKDQQRTTELMEQRVAILRFTNYEVDTMFQEVCERIDDVAKQRVAAIAAV
ncbi:endonuclease domain-containing protein [Bifidobacterium felsineum]|uniref:Endonuclease n=1 Tax=Bifidobacterium felsineum TaxID=2045440 RepID=A0A2M9HMS3_9BIFI|nr:endonuclease domain-containing protein [Bifidobacterium felsineum]MBT1163026.1 DUF559 domain-containing protein [Bifidobacterium felsineum]PJM78118.1 endonuclease [Bifidobacterium felsineum]